jgi:dTDP-4-dehydrorhamnose reductase
MIVKNFEILIIGSDSKIGKYLIKEFKNKKILVWKTTRNIKKISKTNSYLNLKNKNLKWTLPSKSIKIVFFCAGVTSIDLCEKKPVKTKCINVDNTFNILKIINNLNVHFVYFSTNLLFDGSKPWAKDSFKKEPQNVYGKQKLQLESKLKSLKTKNYSIIRFGKIFFQDESIIKNWIINLNKNYPIEVIRDFHVSPITGKQAISIILKIALNFKIGVFQLTSNKDTSYFDLAKILCKKINKNKKLIHVVNKKNNYLPKYTTLYNNNEIIKSPKVNEVINQYFN